jgi:PAS domain S-box-containing protein
MIDAALRSLRRSLFGSVRRQLIVAVALLHAVMMALFVADMTGRQQDMLLAQQSALAKALAESVAVSSAGWIVARDVTGLQEIVDAQRGYPELRYAMALDLQGTVLAHTDRERRGQYVVDLPPSAELAVLQHTPALTDALSPALVAGRHVGWVRVGIGQQATGLQLADLARSGLLYALAAIAIGGALAAWMGTRLTRRLYAIQSAADAVKAGRADARAPTEGSDEAAVLARQFNHMLDALAEREREVTASHDALKFSEARFQRALRGASDGLWEWELRTDNVFYSPRWKAMLGYADDELPNVTGTWHRLIDPQDRERAAATMQACLDGQRSNFESEYRMRHKDGHWVHILARGSLDRDAQGRALRLSGTHVDITELKGAEAELQRHRQHLEELVQERTAALEHQSRRSELILATATDGFFVAGAGGRLLDTNAAFCELLGFTREALLDKALADIDGQAPPQDIVGHVAEVMRDGQARFDTLLRRADGRLVNVEVSLNRVELGGQSMFFAFVRDITQRKRDEQDLRRAKEEAERANLAKSEFLSRMSHELRTPLNAILGFGQLLELKAADPAQAGQVREILQAGQHLLTLIDEVLDLARVESGHLAVSPEPVPVLPLLKDCLNLVRAQANTRNLRLAEPSGSCAVTVRADRTRLKQVLLNLLSNAVKYNREHGTVSVSCVAEPESQPSTLCLRITDTGPGLSAQQQVRLFVPFERLDAENRQIQGTGIGLALSKRLVELMGGSIGVSSSPGAGSTFWVRLPIAQPHAEPSPPAAPADAPMAAPAGDARHDVLCIEDNPANLRLIEGIFARRPDIRLLTAIAPGLGLELARTHRPALILLDINLPDMDGYAVLQRLRQGESTRDIPVIAVSANAMPSDLERAKAAGFDAYVTKPLNLKTLMDQVDALLDAMAEIPAPG